MRSKEIGVVVDHSSLSELADDERELILCAREATRRSYSPYSHFCVGCAARLCEGSIVTGTNFENASYGLSMCAERTVIFSVNNMGQRNNIVAIAITGRPATVGQTYVGEAPVMPCGACRQVINEVEDLADRPILLLMDCFDDDHIIRMVGVSGLLPLAFGPSNLMIRI